jgi:hypothetical protein
MTAAAAALRAAVARGMGPVPAARAFRAMKRMRNLPQGPPGWPRPGELLAARRPGGVPAGGPSARGA